MSSATTLPTFSKGSQGNAVYIVQLILNNFHGFNIKTDGIFGQETENALKDLQQSRSYSPTGVVDQATWQALATAD